MSRRVPGALKNRSGGGLGRFWGVRRELGAQVGIQGDADQIFNDFRVPLGSHFGSFWDDLFDFSMLFCKWLWICVFLFFSIALGIKN